MQRLAGDEASVRAALRFIALWATHQPWDFSNLPGVTAILTVVGEDSVEALEVDGLPPT